MFYELYFSLSREGRGVFKSRRKVSVNIIGAMSNVSDSFGHGGANIFGGSIPPSGTSAAEIGCLTNRMRQCQSYKDSQNVSFKDGAAWCQPRLSTACISRQAGSKWRGQW